MIPIQFRGFGFSLPDKIVDNPYFETLHQVDKGGVFNALGVQERRHCTTESNISMATAALSNALENANCSFESLDLLIHASVSISYILPNTATMIQKALGKEQSGVPCMDVNLSCLSWLAAVEMAGGLIATGRYRRIAIVSSEQPSKVLNDNNLETHALFGDAAAAVIIEPADSPQKGIVKSQFRTYSDGWDLSLIEGGGLEKPGYLKDIPDETYMFQMQNRKLLLYSLKRLNTFLSEFFENESFTWQEIDKIVPHQASRAGLDFFAYHYNIENKLIRNLEKRGNCVAASMPLAFCEAMLDGRIQRGEQVLFIGTAAGISLGGMVVQL
ncbi:MAG: ketoacyl-ACP synthase III [Saprospiraceae bacterium]|nr:ketoacyl-ACP synthase III [Saprospiraceae bacterium]